MEPLSLVVGLAVGGGLGLVGFLSSKRTASGLRRQLEAKPEPGSGQLSKVRSKALALEETVQKHAGTIQQLQQQLKQAQGSLTHAEAKAQQEEQAREELGRKLVLAEKLAGESNNRVRNLESKLGKKGAGGGSHAAAAAKYKAAGQSLDKILRVLHESEKQQAVVVADSNGIVVSSIGDNGLTEGMAAAAQLFAQFGAQIEGMVPFGQVATFRMSDEKSKVISGRAFGATGETVTLATYGDTAPDDQMLDSAANSLHAALS